MASRGAAGKPEWSSGRGKSWGPRKAAVTGHSAFAITRFCCSFGIFRATTMGPFFTCVGFWRLNLRHSCTLRPVCAWPPPNAPYHSPQRQTQAPGSTATRPLSTEQTPPGAWPHSRPGSPCLQTFVHSPDVQTKLMRGRSRAHALSPRAITPTRSWMKAPRGELCTCGDSLSSRGTGVNCTALCNGTGS